MKKYMIFGLFVLMSSLSFAQTQLSFGPKAGLNLSTFTATGNAGMKLRTGFQAGGMVNLPFSKVFSIQSELFYSAEGTGAPDVQYALNYLRFPLLVQVRHPSGLFAQAGPQAGYLLSGKAINDVLNNKTDLKESISHFETSFVMGIGYRMPAGLGFELRYAAGLSQLESQSAIKMQTCHIGISYLIAAH